MTFIQGIPLPRKSDPRWAKLVTSGTGLSLKLLGLKLMLTRMNGTVKRDPSPANVAKNIDELYAFFAANPKMVEDDTKRLFG